MRIEGSGGCGAIQSCGYVAHFFPKDLSMGIGPQRVNRLKKRRVIVKSGV